MSNNNHPRSEDITDHESIEIESPEVLQNQAENLEREGDDLWSLLQQQFSSTECLINFVLFLVIVLFIVNVVALILALTGAIC